MARNVVKIYLGVDGGGSKTAFLLIDESGRVLASHTDGPAYYLETGWDHMRAMLDRGIRAVSAQSGVDPNNIDFSFLGLPAYGEDSGLLPAFDAAASPALARDKYICENDAVCGWAGALACKDGINIIAGTGSMAYGEFGNRTARVGGWGELFSDEGSAYWIAREALSLFSRMADGRTERGALYDIVRRHFQLKSDLDLCAAIYGENGVQRSGLAALAPLVAEAASAGDTNAAHLFTRAADELASIVRAAHRRLEIPVTTPVIVSYTGGLFRQDKLLLNPLKSILTADSRQYLITAPHLTPVAGAALYAAKLHGSPLGAAAITALKAS
jgi:N-acetylglucosamine kinase-like BadF-type ATPase